METLNFGPLIQSKADSTVGLIVPKWYYPKSDLMRSPSILGGYSYDREQNSLRQAAAFGRDLALRMNEIPNTAKLSSLCISVAIIQMRRFFLVNRLSDYDPRDVITSTMFLASKSEECPRRLKDLVLCFYRLKVEVDCPKDLWELNSKLDKKTYEHVAAYLVWLENVILQTTGFDFNVEVPHPFVLKMCETFFPDDHLPREIGFWLATDSLHMTDWSVRYRPETVACIVIFVMVMWKEVDIPTIRVVVNGETLTKRFFDVKCELSYGELLDITNEYTEILKENQSNRLLAITKYRDAEIRQKTELNTSKNEREPGEI
ncbi:unnamed protein product [Bursaphelenchus okinawaensis]|uniref:Cyclin N-terminal domain-containing protein n=1 Tax=Bursaphelenchus okinawaensis TaxID=465554 RepID=A0A811KLH7_9BILA|nr:unnamed protein product [Bursaphelenchus okinawaensis]CAG9106249.1 unnamed protein product [Bursaphelenchus okinawaensis]